MTNGKLFAGAVVSLLLSLAVYAVLAGLLSWWYFAGFLGNPDLQFDPSRLAWMKRFWLPLSWFVGPICLWWAAVFLTEARRGVPAHRRFASADLWLLGAAMLWGLLVYAVSAGRFLPTEFTTCRENAGLGGLCGRTRPGHFWFVTGVVASLILIGLVQRLRRIPRGGRNRDSDRALPGPHSI